MKAPASVRVAMKLLPTVGQELSERLVAHDDMGNRRSVSLVISRRRCDAEQMNQALVQFDSDLCNEKRRLHDVLSLKGQLHHGMLGPKTIDFEERTLIERDGFRMLSVAAAGPTASFGKKSAKGLVEHRDPGLQSGLGRTTPHRRQVGPKDQPHDRVVGLDLIARYEQARERFRFRQVRRVAISVNRHFHRSRLNSVSRANPNVPRGRRHPAGMVGLVPVQTHLLSSFCSLPVSVSVAGNGDSNDRFWKLRRAFRDLRIPFRDSAAWRWSHV